MYAVLPDRVCYKPYVYPDVGVCVCVPVCVWRKICVPLHASLDRCDLPNVGSVVVQSEAA